MRLSASALFAVFGVLRCSSVAKQVIRGVAFPVKSFLLGAVSGLPNMNEYTGRAWFIYCFFVAEILFYFLLKWTKGKRTPLFLLR